MSVSVHNKPIFEKILKKIYIDGDIICDNFGDPINAGASLRKACEDGDKHSNGTFKVLYS
jgi:hypothetical protein